jgi:hypothetical protein
MRWMPQILRSALLGAVIGLVLVLALRGSSEEVDWRLAAGAVVLLVVGLASRRWLAARAEASKDGAKS